MNKQIKWEKLFVETDKEEIAKESEDTQILLPMMRPQFRMNLFDRETFFVGNTNFRIDRDTLYTIEDVEGVETLNYVTPYKMVVSIAKSFDPDHVLNTICNSLVTELPLKDADLPKEAIEAIEYLEDYADWCLYILPNQKVEYACLEESEEEFTDRVDMLQEACGICGGLLIKAGNND